MTVTNSLNVAKLLMKKIANCIKSCFCRRTRALDKNVWGCTRTKYERVELRAHYRRLELRAHYISMLGAARAM